jgi:hypothetical protein
MQPRDIGKTSGPVVPNLRRIAVSVVIVGYLPSCILAPPAASGKSRIHETQIRGVDEVVIGRNTPIHELEDLVID